MQPIYAEIELPGGVRTSTICKFPTRSNRAPIEQVINEWIVTVAGRLVGLQVPPCYIVEASPHVMLHLVERHGVTLACNFGFAAEVCPIDALIYPSSLDAMDPEDLTRLFCFDMLFLNADRTPNNPNCGQSNRRLFAYDFGSALVSPGTAPNSFERLFFGPNMADRAAAHLCRSHVGPSVMAQKVLQDLIAAVSKNRWYAGMNLKFLPVALQEQMRLAVQYFDYVVQERDLLCRQIVSTL